MHHPPILPSIMSRIRHIVAPWLFSTVTMFVLSLMWHGLFLQDLEELSVPLAQYLVRSAGIYLLIGLVLTMAAHKAIQLAYVSLKGAFPIKLAMMGGAFGILVFAVLFLLGLSFTKPDAVHVMADLVWQMAEQAAGGVAVSLGIIYDLRQSFLEEERAS